MAVVCSGAGRAADLGRIAPLAYACAGHAYKGFMQFCGLTWILGFGGMLAAALGRRDLAGLAWLSLGAGSVGVAFDRATSGQLHFDHINRRTLTEEEQDFLAGHLPFLFLGLLALSRGNESKGEGCVDV